jgi:transposase
MGQSKSFELRLTVSQLRDSGQTYIKIAQDLGLSEKTVRTWCKRYVTSGISGLTELTKNNKGRPLKVEDARSYRFVRLLKHLHPMWGIPFILTKLREDYPELLLENARLYQRRLKVHYNLLPEPTLPPKPIIEKSRIAHDTWQIDAKERLVMLDGQVACYLTIVDEGTGTLLAAEPFPP